MRIPEYPRCTVVYQKNKYIAKGLGSRMFQPYSDSTDHFWFECTNCGRRAIVEEVRVTNYNGYPEIYMDFSCDNCYVYGTRKYWLGEGS